jgi:hypothetical protein
MWMAASTDVEQRAGNGQAQVVAGEGKKANSGNAAPASARFLLNWVICSMRACVSLSFQNPCISRAVGMGKAAGASFVALTATVRPW